MVYLRMVEIGDWESECYNCNKVFRNRHNALSRLPPRDQILINIHQKDVVKTFCSRECKLDYIFSLQRERGLDWIH